MSYLLERLRDLKASRKNKAVAPTVEFVHRKKKTSGKALFVFIISVVFVLAGLLLVAYLQNLTPERTTRDYISRKERPHKLKKPEVPAGSSSLMRKSPKEVPDRPSPKSPSTEPMDKAPPVKGHVRTHKKQGVLATDSHRGLSSHTRKPPPADTVKPEPHKAGPTREILSRRNSYLYTARTMMKEGKLSEAR